MCLCHFDDLELSLFSSRPPWMEEVLGLSGTISSKTTLVLYGQASRAISIG